MRSDHASHSPKPAESPNPAPTPLQIGVTGGIGSGKSTVCRMFAVLGVPVYHADDRAKALMVEDAELVDGIRSRFGAVYDEAGHLLRKALADRVFKDPEALADLNALVHPAVFRDAKAWSEGLQDQPYLLREAALLYESGSWQQVDEVLMVWAPKALRLQRVVHRDGLSEADVLARMARQMPDDEKRDRADHVLLNDGSGSVIQEVWRLHQHWLQKVGGGPGKA